jgi:hypothetical protein
MISKKSRPMVSILPTLLALHSGALAVAMATYLEWPECIAFPPVYPTLSSAAAPTASESDDPTPVLLSPQPVLGYILPASQVNLFYLLRYPRVDRSLGIGLAESCYPRAITSLSSDVKHLPIPNVDCCASRHSAPPPPPLPPSSSD